MRVDLITPPWGNTWIEGLRKVFSGHEFNVLSDVSPGADVRIYGWADGRHEINGSSVNIVFMRRYELYTLAWQRMDWEKIQCLICVNDFVAGHVRAFFAEKNIRTEIHVIYNAVDEHWTYAERKANNQLGMACHVHMKKNIPLALQILARLPGYELHIAGEIQDSCTVQYLNHIAARKKLGVYLYGHVDSLNEWWENMGFCLSTSISEGNPNNVNEAMAKGIKPVIHNWPGAEEQYPEECVFETVDQAVEKIKYGYNSRRYREWVEDKFSMTNLERVVELATAHVGKRRAR